MVKISVLGLSVLLVACNVDEKGGNTGGVDPRDSGQCPQGTAIVLTDST